MRRLFAPLALVLLSSVAEAEQIALPREKPVTDQDAPTGPQRQEIVSSYCLRALQDTGVVAQQVSSPESRGECTIEEPVAVETVDTHTGTVTLPGRPILDCQFAAVLGAWLAAAHTRIQMQKHHPEQVLQELVAHFAGLPV